MTSVTFSYTAEDYLAANQLNQRLVYFSRKGLRALVIIWIFYFALAMALTEDFTIGNVAILAGATALGSMVIAAIIVGLNAVLLPRRSKRLFLQQKSLEGEFETRWTSERVELFSPAGDGRHPWRHFIKAAENDRIIMLYQSDLMYNMIPKRALDAAALREIRDALSANGVPLLVR